MPAILRLLGWWLLGGVLHCLVASGGGGTSEKQLDNQLDCWWKAKGLPGKDHNSYSVFFGLRAMLIFSRRPQYIKNAP